MGQGLRGEDGSEIWQGRGDVGDRERGPMSPDRAPELSPLCLKRSGPGIGRGKDLVGGGQSGGSGIHSQAWASLGKTSSP